MKTLTECIHEAMTACQQAGFTQATTDNITSMACTLYIQGSKGNSGNRSYSGSGANRKADVPKEQQKGAPTGQIMQVGYPCGWCGQGLKQSKSGNAYCKCWYEADPNKVGALPPQAPAPNNYPQQ